MKIKITTDYPIDVKGFSAMCRKNFGTGYTIQSIESQGPYFDVVILHRESGRLFSFTAVDHGGDGFEFDSMQEVRTEGK